MMQRALMMCLAVLSASTASAQTPATGTLRVTVVDATGAVIAGASVKVLPVDPAPPAGAAGALQTSETGIATAPALVPGRYTIEAAFPGFETRILKDIRVRPGDNRQVAVLQIERMEASVTVGEDKQRAAADPRGRSFGTT